MAAQECLKLYRQKKVHQSLGVIQHVCWVYYICVWHSYAANFIRVKWSGALVVGIRRACALVGLNVYVSQVH